MSGKPGPQNALFLPTTVSRRASVRLARDSVAFRCAHAVD